MPGGNGPVPLCMAVFNVYPFPILRKRIDRHTLHAKMSMDEGIKDIWHVYSDGTRADIPFNTEEDKLFAWNSVAVCAEIAVGAGMGGYGQ